MLLHFLNSAWWEKWVNIIEKLNFIILVGNSVLAEKALLQ